MTNTRFSSILPMLIITALIVYWSCNKEEAIQTSEITEIIINHTDCKNTKSAKLNDEFSSDESCILYAYNEETKELTLDHKNAGFNCCPGEIYCQASIAGDTIIVTTFEEEAQCKCNCLYDLNIKLNTIEPGIYILKLKEQYCGEQDKLIFQLDLNNNQEGEFCVTRNNYPWGL